MAKKYKHADDPFPSAVRYVLTSDELHLLCLISKTYYLDVSNQLAKVICSKFDIKELLIHPTFKTNSEFLELFVLNSKLVGEGFPLGYLLVEAKPGQSSNARNAFRREAIHTFLTSLKSHLQALNPSVFFTDKDASQMKSIQEVF